MSEPLRLAVVVPARNAAATLERALLSAHRQVPRPAVVVVVDDGSTDATAVHAARLDALVIRHAHSKGAAAARDAGARAVLDQVDAVAFLDADDEYVPGFLADAAATLERHPAATLVFGHAVERRGDGSWRTPPPFPSHHLHQPLWPLAWANLVPTSAAVVPVRAYRDSGGFSPAMGSHAEDYDLWLRLARRGPFASTGRVGVVRYVEDNSFSRRPEALERMLHMGLRAVARNAPAVQETAPWFSRIATGHIYREAARRALARSLADHCRPACWTALRCNPADPTAWALLAASYLPGGVRQMLLAWRRR